MNARLTAVKGVTRSQIEKFQADHAWKLRRHEAPQARITITAVCGSGHRVSGWVGTRQGRWVSLHHRGHCTICGSTVWTPEIDVAWKFQPVNNWIDGSAILVARQARKLVVITSLTPDKLIDRQLKSSENFAAIMEGREPPHVLDDATPSPGFGVRFLLEE